MSIRLNSPGGDPTQAHTPKVTAPVLHALQTIQPAAPMSSPPQSPISTISPLSPTPSWIDSSPGSPEVSFGLQYQNSASQSTVSSSMSSQPVPCPKRVDPCADPEMVAAIRVANIDDDAKDEYNEFGAARRTSVRVQRAASSAQTPAPVAVSQTPAPAPAAVVKPRRSDSKYWKYVPEIPEQKIGVFSETPILDSKLRPREKRTFIDMTSEPDQTPSGVRETTPQYADWDTEDSEEEFESDDYSSEEEEEEEPASDDTMEGMVLSTPMQDEEAGPKKRKLNSGDAIGELGLVTHPASAAPAEVPISRHALRKEDIDSRILRDVITFSEGRWMVPGICKYCRELRQFCDRAPTCQRCAASGRTCEKAPSLTFARAGGFRPRPGGSGPKLPKPKKKKIRTEYQDSPSGSKGKRGLKSSVKVKKEEEEVVILKVVEEIVDPQADKPAPIGKPLVWCDSRQELCESLPYFRAYQSGIYAHDGLAHGFLVDGTSSPRDYMDGKVVISHGGGKSATGADGMRTLTSHQTLDDKTVRYLLANMKDKFPIAMIIGNKCSFSTCQVPHRYCVMDWFKVTASWAELETRSRCVRWKFKFEKLDQTSDGWWVAEATKEEEGVEIPDASCCVCRQDSQTIYQEGWMCLNPTCPSFWKISGIDAPEELTYTDAFLKHRTHWDDIYLTPPSHLAPVLNMNRDIFFDGNDVSRVNWKGMCCPRCGRLNCRELWAGWRCLACDFNFGPPRTILDAARLADPHRPAFNGPAVPANYCSEEITHKRSILAGMTVVQYQLGSCGTVTHMLANQTLNARPRDADWLLTEYQSVDVPFKRFPMKNHQASGRLLTQHFAFNCGAPYKYIVDVESHPFDKAPAVVNRALEIIHERVRLLFADAEFNEILNVGYFEKQKMDYHDDGEKGLGETVASISLGAPARMRFRIKSKHSGDQRLIGAENPVTPCKAEPEDLEDEQEEREENTDSPGHADPAVNALASPPRKQKGGRVKLDLCLSHGDVMIMSGRDIQQYWEHSVIPQGLFRIAITARKINDDHPGIRGQVKIEPRDKNVVQPESPTVLMEIKAEELNTQMDLSEAPIWGGSDENENGDRHFSQPLSGVEALQTSEIKPAMSPSDENNPTNGFSAMAPVSDEL